MVLARSETSKFGDSSLVTLNLSLVTDELYANFQAGDLFVSQTLDGIES
jgi:hypothetical protein